MLNETQKSRSSNQVGVPRTYPGSHLKQTLDC